ncbi:MAG: hypothetical protein LBR22_00950 [Desulfovibrio sp.]|jgi:hypothetical protein|nr:hypothetical protein [Desulfovibrio sp.]
MSERVDATVNIFGRPYQTAISLLSLLKCSGRHIDVLYLQYEPKGSQYDLEPPYAIARYLEESKYNIVLHQPKIWIEIDVADVSRMGDAEYRQAIRYQYAFEHTDKRLLFILHNDVMFRRDYVGHLMEAIPGFFAAGPLGQCWNCPASREDLVRAAGIPQKACTPETYLDFRPTPDQLKRLYDAAAETGFPVRRYRNGLASDYGTNAHPLPECRVNEWCCLVDVGATRGLVMPEGPILPFGAYAACDGDDLDLSVVWFRELHRRGLRARHAPCDKFVKHWGGNFRMSRKDYDRAESDARAILKKGYPEFVEWCRDNGSALFAENTPATRPLR